MGHFIQRRRDQSAQADYVRLSFAGGLQNFFAGRHHAQVNDFVVVAAEHDADNVLADVMHVAFDGGHEDASLRLMVARGLLFLFHERQEVSDGFLHHPRALDDLRQEHFARAEQVADNVHAGHERSFDDGQWAAKFLARLFGIQVNVIHDAFDQGVAEAFLDRSLAPLVFLDLGLVRLFDGLGEFDQPFGGVRPAVEQHVLNQCEQVPGDLFVHCQHAGVDDAQVQPGFDGMIKKGRVHSLADDIVSPEGE